MKARALSSVVLAALVAGACAAVGRLDKVELTTQGPSAEEFFVARSYALNGRAPNFDEKRRWESEMEDRVFAYLRDHPELEQTSRYSDFRFWWQVATGSTPAEVSVLLPEPQEKTIDVPRMAALAERQWAEIESKAKEAWVYTPAWVIYFDDTSVVAMVHRVSSAAARY
jgi:hypothetical protein